MIEYRIDRGQLSEYIFEASRVGELDRMLDTQIG
jgi:hypothetical protein